MFINLKVLNVSKGRWAVVFALLFSHVLQGQRTQENLSSEGLKGAVKRVIQKVYSDNFTRTSEGGAVYGNFIKIYNQSGGLIEYILSSDVKGQKILFSYQNGYIKTKEHFYANGDLYMKWDYFSNKNGHIDSVYIYNALLQIDSKGYYTYKDNLVTSTVSYDITGALEEEEKYDYDKKGKLVKLFWKRSTDYIQAYYTYKYDAKGNIIEQRSFSTNNQLNSITKFKYDKKGNKIEERFFDEDSNLTNVYKFEYVFDKMGNWIKCIKYADDAAEYTFEREIFYFN